MPGQGFSRVVAPSSGWRRAEENLFATRPMSELGRYCSLIPGLNVKLSTTFLAGPTVLSAVGACPPHDGVR
jgi:hypothetical protein